MIFGHYRSEITHLHLFPSLFFLIKWLFYIDLGFILFFVISSSCCGIWFCVVILLRCFVFVVLLRRFVFVVLLLRFVFVVLLRHFILRVGDSDKPSIFDQTETKNQIMVVDML